MIRINSGRGIACASGAVLCASVLAQDPSFDDESARLPDGIAGQCMDAAAGDADGDGDVDLVLAMEFRPNLLLLNDGSGTFVLAVDRLPPTRHDSEDIAFVDLDGDADRDLVFVSEDDRADELFLNDGAGRFSNASERLPWRDVSNALVALDLDGDGALDLLTGNVGINRALINDGNGRFRDRTDELWPQSGGSRTQDIELVDVDGDNDLDVVVANEGQNQLYINTGGRLVDVTATALPMRADETREIRSGDLDGDGDSDLVVANVSFVMSESPRDYILFNDGSAHFSVSFGNLPENSRNNFTVQVHDLDDDGAVDVLVPSSDFPLPGLGGSERPNRRGGDYLALLNDGTGGFTAAPPDRIIPDALSGNGFDIEIADFDGDGARDLFLCNRASAPDPRDAAESGGRQYLLLRVVPAAL